MKSGNGQPALVQGRNELRGRDITCGLFNHDDYIERKVPCDRETIGLSYESADSISFGGQPQGFFAHSDP